MPDIEDLLAPIPGARPAGEDLSFSLEYDAIQEARRADDPSLAQGEWVTDLKSADWGAVDSLCARLLQQRSKDLRLAVWWAEAQTHHHGFAGLARGYRLVAGLCERYWDDIQPQPEDEGDLEQRIGNLGWLISHSQTWLRRLPLTQAPQGCFGLADFEAVRARRDEDGGPAPETLEAARRDTPHAFYVRLAGCVPECRQALAELERAVDARLGADGPGFSALRDQLEHLGHTVIRFARDAGVLIAGDEVPETRAGRGAGTGHGAGSTDEPVAPTSANGAVASRKEAIAQLRRVAEFFRRTEPHSPVAYLADKAANWGEMPLHVWLKRVIKDDGTLAAMEEMLDVGDAARPPAD